MTMMVVIMMAVCMILTGYNDDGGYDDEGG